jgi:hypothetical protein
VEAFKSCFEDFRQTQSRFAHGYTTNNNGEFVGDPDWDMQARRYADHVEHGVV